MINEDKIEFLLIGLVFASSIILTLLGLSIIKFIVIGFLILLALYYTKVVIADKIASGILLVFLVQCVLILLDSEYTKMASSLFFLSVAIWVIYIALKHSREYQSLELVELSVGILLSILLLSHWVDMSQFGLPQEGVTLILPFAICFSIGTLMYSPNLWMRYSEGFKKVLTVVLVQVLSQLLIQTIKNVSI
ncbi:MAG: hypothetical protein U0U66_06080 [Cytophagaceae bacterium]